MKTVNASLQTFIQHIQDKKVYLYGLGEVFRSLEEKEIFLAIYPYIAGYIDNGKAGQTIDVLGEKYSVAGVENLNGIRDGIVLICGTKYLDDMYRDLCEQNLSDAVECFVLPLIWAVTVGQDDEWIKQRINSNMDDLCKMQIEKKIHCFWFSGDEKPEAYRRCIDSWRRVCPDYEIIEWNAENYDCGKNQFMCQAYEKRKWAFVSDYARLDVVYRYGGIYLDMDVEILKRLDPLLQFKAFFSFGTQHEIDLGSGFGSVKGNPFLRELLNLYENKDFCDENGNPMVWKYVQPVYIKNTFRKNGIQMNGNMQLQEDTLILPRKYFTPVDDFMLEDYVRTEESVGIHHYNAGWCDTDFMEQRKVKAFWRDVMRRLI